MHKVRCMVDLETLGIGKNALILSIGAVRFDTDIGIMSSFYTAVKQEDQMTMWGRTVTPSTLEWWGKQSPEARKVLTDPTAQRLDIALQSFAVWHTKGQEIWAGPSTFDIVILENAFDAVGLPVPWSYRDIRDLSTLCSLEIADPNAPQPTRIVHHNALDDARYQAEIAIQELRRLADLKSYEKGR